MNLNVFHNILKSMKFFTIAVALGFALIRQADSAVTADCG